MDNQTANQQPIIIQKPVDIEPQKLLDALFFFWEGFDRASLDFFVIKDTAKNVVKDTDLTGDRVTLGVRANEWNSGQGRIFKDYMIHERVSPVEKQDNYILFIYKEVPVYVYVYKDNPYLKSFDTVYYRYETFKTPNPYKEFSEQYE